MFIILIILNFIISSMNSGFEHFDNESLQNFNTDFFRKKRAITRNIGKSHMWPNATLYYKISCTEYTTEELNRINIALFGIENKTCIQFIQIDSNSKVRDYVNILCRPNLGCLSEVGMLGGEQKLNLARSQTKYSTEGCTSIRIIQHEFLHALGFRHEINLAYRDQYIDIIKDNIDSKWDQYFEVDLRYNLERSGCKFDFNSIMMPPSIKHSKNGEYTFTPKVSSYAINLIGKVKQISECDVIRMNNIYCGK